MADERPLVDLISDTATRPTPGMYEAMHSAPLGDEQKGEDPTVNALQERAAELLGTERALFVPTASMANQIAIALHCGPGDELLCHPTAHVRNHETGAVSVLARAQLSLLDGERGFFTGEQVRAAVRVDDPHFPDVTLVVVENTSNGGGGGVWPDDVFDGVADACDELDVALHIDGARLMNAAVQAGVSPARWGARATTVQMCFSKGLGCPFGAMLGLPAARFREARRWKQRLGGALRQAGVIAGAMLYALDHHADRLADDHRRAQQLADGLRSLEGVTVEPVETNLVYFRLPEGRLDAAAFASGLRGHGVRVGAVSDTRVRACLHLDVDDAGVQRTLDAARAVLA